MWMLVLPLKEKQKEKAQQYKIMPKRDLTSLIQAPAWPASHRAKSGTSDPPVSRKLRTVTFGHWSWIFKTPFSHVHQYMNFTVSPSPQGFPLNPLPPQVYQTVFLVASNKWTLLPSSTRGEFRGGGQISRAWWPELGNRNPMVSDSHVAQTKNPPAMQETRIHSLHREDP